MQLTITTLIFGLPTGQRTYHVRLTLPASTLTVQELIAHKIRQEVEECLVQQRPGLSGEARAPEVLLRAAIHALPLLPGVMTDEIVQAQQAFAARTYMIVVDNQRLWHPEDTLSLQADTQIEFIKILPLVGG